jgi:large subunit ribosomal protein L17
MFRNMVTSLFKYEKIQTTEIKAKALKALADHLVSLAKRGDLHARRQAMSIIREKPVVHKLFETAQKRFGGISGGYTRVLKLAFRPGDSAPMSLVQLYDTDRTLKDKTREKDKPSRKAETPAKRDQSERETVQTEAEKSREPVAEQPPGTVTVAAQAEKTKVSDDAKTVASGVEENIVTTTPDETPQPALVQQEEKKDQDDSK